METEKKGKGSAEMDFSAFISGLMMQASSALGMFEGLEEGEKKDLRQAETIVEVLSMLKKKTKGNLTEQETGLLEEILHQLRIGYVSALESKRNEDDNELSEKNKETP